MNAGIADAHNLAWKLAYVLRGEAGPELLESYHAERHPVALMTMEQARLRFDEPSLHWGKDMAAARKAAGTINAPVVHPGYRYGGAELPSTEDVVLDLDGSPGSRLPHMWVADGVSTLDLVGSQWCVVTADPDVKADAPARGRNGCPLRPRCWAGLSASTDNARWGGYRRPAGSSSPCVGSDTQWMSARTQTQRARSRRIVVTGTNAIRRRFLRDECTENDRGMRECHRNYRRTGGFPSRNGVRGNVRRSVR